MEPKCFLPGPTKKFSPQNGEKIEEKNWTSFFGQKFPCAIAHGLVYVTLLHTFFFFLFSFSFLLDVNLGIFSLIPLKNFLSKIERKLKGKFGHHFWTKMPMCNCTWPCLRCSSSFFLSFIIFFFFFFPLGHCLFFFLLLLLSFVVFFFFLVFFLCDFVFCLDVNFFSRHDFYFF